MTVHEYIISYYSSRTRMRVCWRNCTSFYAGNEILFGNNDEDYDDENNSNNKIINLATSLLIVIVSEMKMLWKSWLSPFLTDIRTYHHHHHHHHHHNHHHHHLANMELGHMLTYSGLKNLGISLNVSPGFFCLCLLSSVIYHETFCLYVATIFFCIPVFYPKLGLYLFLAKFLCLFFNLLKCALLFFSYILPLLLFLLRLLLKWSNFLNRITAGMVNVFYNFNLAFFEVFSVLNILFIMPVIFQSFFPWLFMSTSFSKYIRFPKKLKEFILYFL